jgi:hypothetical protein
LTRAREVANVLSTATSLATDTETAAAISSHNSATTSVHGITNTATLATQTYADSAVSTHAAAADPHASYLKESEYWTAGKNKIINGDFAINQRSFSSTSTHNTYMFDRWLAGINGTATFSAQTFTPGSAPVAGYEGVNFIRVAGTTQSSAGNYISLSQRIEDVRTLAGKTVTVSFWAKAASGTPNIAVELYQDWINGSSHTYSSNIPITTSWARYSVTLTLPSMSGNTIGANSYTQLWFFTSVGSTITGFGYPPLGLQTATIDFWGVQVEVGSTVTPFNTATGTLAGELAACQRYYYRRNPNSAAGGYGLATIQAYSTSFGYAMLDFPTTMRGVPTLTVSANANDYRAYVNNLVDLTAVPGLQTGGTDYALLSISTSNGLYAIGAAGWLASDSAGDGFLAFNAEL